MRTIGKISALSAAPRAPPCRSLILREPEHQADKTEDVIVCPTKTRSRKVQQRRLCLNRSSQVSYRMSVKFLLSLAVLLALTSAALPQQRPLRLALVIGNANYPDAGTPLPTTVKDARTLAEEFRRLDFNVDLQENLGKEEMKRAIDAFTGKIKPGAEALFYFGGFGLQAGRRSYLIPVNAQIWSEADVSREGVSVDDLLTEMNRRGAKVKIIIVDAARRNPFERRFRASPLGLAPLGAPDGTLALFSAAPGTVMNERDGAAANSILVSELIKELRSPNQPAEQAFSRTRIGVSRASNNEIVPWVASSLLEEYYFKPSPSGWQSPQPAPGRAPVPEAAAPPPAPEPPAAIASPAPQPARPPAPAAVTPPAPAATAPTRFSAGQTFRDCADCPEMVVVPAGSFMMGSNAEYERPVHRVTIDKPFAIGRYEVTFAEWSKCTDEGACNNHRPNDRGWGRGNRPVIDVSWGDAKAYAAWLSKKTGQTYRLPSEAEWEYAARGGTKTPYWWGQDVGSRNANCQECNTGQASRTLPVGSMSPNPFGLFDTAGNAAEWVEDCWNDNYRGAPTNGTAWTSGQCRLRVLRGGAFDSQALYVGSGSRFRYDYDVRYSANGFRLVRELP
jgi:formylglycine-generating enzyme required for sulfatase activity